MAFEGVLSTSMPPEPNTLATPARTPEPPYFAVIFTSTRKDGDHGYAEMAKAMEELGRTQPGFLGIDSVRDASGLGITVAYYDSLDAVREWKANGEHRIAQRL